MTTPFVDEVSRKIARGFAELWLALPRVENVDDEDAVHDVRVASRRLRAVMEAGAPCFPESWFAPLLGLVKDITGELGAVRDAEVMLAFLRSEHAGADPAERPGIERLVNRLEGELSAHRAEMTRFLGDLQHSPLLPQIEHRFGEKARPPWLDLRASDGETT